MHNFKENGFREIDFVLTKKSINSLKKEWKNYCKQIPEFPAGFNGKGIVMCGGGIKYFTCAWVAIKIIRKTQCKLPIELWHSKGELDEHCIKELDKMNVHCKCVNDFFDGSNVYGWELKIHAILKSSFEEVVFIDADNICLRNPDILLEIEEYKQTGAIFWPDYWRTAADNPIWDIMGLEFIDMREQESGQMVINKQKSWQALNLCLFLNRNKDIYYKLLLGDKDTFRFSWLALKKEFFMVKKTPDSCGYLDSKNNFMGITMVQYTPNETRPFFLHRNLIKWDITPDDKYYWTIYKKYDEGCKDDKYTLSDSFSNRHIFVDLVGSYVQQSFVEYFGNIESICMKELKQLRAKRFYLDFILKSYISNR